MDSGWCTRTSCFTCFSKVRSDGRWRWGCLAIKDSFHGVCRLANARSWDELTNQLQDTGTYQPVIACCSCMGFSAKSVRATM